MALQRGERLPDVTLPSHDKREVALIELQGRRLVVLFFPLAFSSVCTEEMCQMGEDLGAYRELEAEVVAISVDSPYALARFRQECNADFPFLSDFNREASRAFGVLRTDPLGPGLRDVSDRAAFVFGEQGTVVYAWHSTNPGQMPPFDEIKQALRSLD